MEEQSRPSKKVIIINFALIVIICVGLFVYMVHKDGIDNIVSLLKQVDYKWVAIGLIFLALHWFCEALNVHLSIKRMYKDQSLTNSIKVGMIGLLFNNITPFSSGGQPMQAYELYKTGKRVSDSMSALAMKFAITQTALVLTTIVISLFQFDFFMNIMKDYIWVAILGFGINILAIIIVILLGINKNIIKKISNGIIIFLSKIRIIKHPDETKEKISKSIDNFSEQFKAMDRRLVIKMFIVAVIETLLYYSLTYTVYRAFGNYGVSYWQIIPIQAFLLLIMTFIPTPGSGLGAEGGFLLLFNSIFKEGTINMSILFWRIYTFYLPIIVGAFFLIPTKGKITKRTVDYNSHKIEEEEENHE